MFIGFFFFFFDGSFWSNIEVRDLALGHGPNCQALTSSSVTFSSTTLCVAAPDQNVRGSMPRLTVALSTPAPSLTTPVWVNTMIIRQYYDWNDRGLGLVIDGSHSPLSPCSPPCGPSSGEAASQVLAAHL